MTLNSLVESLDGSMASGVNARRERLLVVVQALLAESATTARLIRYALDFNNKLMAALTGVDVEGNVYSHAGEVQALCGESRNAGLAGASIASSTFEHSA